MEVVIGYREILKAIESGKVEKVLVARNCPQFILSKLETAGANIEKFDGDERDLAVKFGKPFPVSSVGILKE